MNTIIFSIGLFLILISIVMIILRVKSSKLSKQILDDDSSHELNYIENKQYQNTEFTTELNNATKSIELQKVDIKENKREYSSESKSNNYADDSTKLAEAIKNNNNEKTNNKVESIQKIIELSKLGYSPEEIAKNLKKGVREVEIILKLYSKKEKK